jgi:hypothetical protein
MSEKLSEGYTISDLTMNFINKVLESILKPIGIILFARRGQDYYGNNCVYFFSSEKIMNEDINGDNYEYAVFSSDEHEGKWIFSYVENYSGSFNEPPNSENIFDKNLFLSSGYAFNGLLHMIIATQLDNIAEAVNPLEYY